MAEQEQPGYIDAWRDHLERLEADQALDQELERLLDEELVAQAAAAAKVAGKIRLVEHRDDDHDRQRTQVR